MPRRDVDDDDLEPEEGEEVYEDEEEDYDDYKTGRKRSRSQFIDDAAEEDEDEDKEEEDDDEDEDEDYGGGARKGGKGGAPKAKKRSSGSHFFDLEAMVDSDEDDEEDEGEDDFIVDNGADLPDDEDAGQLHRRPLLPCEDDQEDEAFERSIQARYARSSHTEYDEETTDVEQQTLLPSARDPKLWMVKCAIGHEWEVAVCLCKSALIEDLSCKLDLL